MRKSLFAVIATVGFSGAASAAVASYASDPQQSNWKALSKIYFRPRAMRSF